MTSGDNADSLSTQDVERIAGSAVLTLSLKYYRMESRYLHQIGCTTLTMLS